MSFLPQHNDDDDDDDSLSSISSTSPTPASATMASPPCSPTRGNNLLQPTIISSSSPPKVILEPKEVVHKQTTRRVGRHGIGISNHKPATAVRIAIDMRTRSSRLFFVLLHLVGVSTNVPYGGDKRRRTPSTTYYPSSSSNNDSHYGSDLFSFIIPSWLTWSVGIVGVHPTGILLERLDVQSSRRGLRGILERVERVWQWDGNEDLLGEPYWFQDNTDGMCLGPDGGFSECGDATLWKVKRRPLTKRQLREKRYKQRHRQRVQQDKNKRAGRGIKPTTDSVCVWPFFCEQYSQVSQPMHIGNDEVYGFEYENHDDEVGNEGFALQLMGVDAITANSVFSSHRMAGLKEERKRKRFFWHEQEEDDPEGECLLSFPSAKNGGDALQIGSCSSEAAWVWHVNRDGILVRGSTKAEKRKRQRRWKITPRRASAAAAAGGSGSLQSDFRCVHRTNSTMAALLPCGIEGKSRDDNHNSLVGFSLVRYPSTVSKRVPQQQHGLGFDPSLVWEPWTTLEVHVSESLDNNDSQTKEDSGPSIPKSRTSSASAGAKQPTLKATPNMLHTGLDQGKAKKHSITSASHIRDAPVAMNGVAFHKQRMNNKSSSEKSARKPSMGPTGSKLRLEKDNRERGGQTQIHEDLVESRMGDHAPNSNPHRPRKIPVHPYIQSSKDFVWVDPLTSLEYPTDLCEYLGHTKKEAGRHTLMGVGQYYRTAFNIKVYGAALYVAKRDVLADPKFGEYATLSSEDLRGRDDFYEHLMNMPTPGEDPADSIGGFFDRTLLVKINMQLSTDAMRKSLEADWSLLTDEMKATIIDSSFKERMADEKMQQKIQSKENSSNCSCGQLAPPEFKADPTCCARGTELGFTWRKNGDFEVRLDGRLMDVFPRPDIAKGIFAEYLNDNPISLDAKAHFTDGFPFLLAPLAQLKGMSSAIPQSHKPSEEKVKSPSSNNPMHRMMNAAMNSMDAMNNQAHLMSKWMQDSSSSAVGSALGLARELSEELDKQRIDLLENAVALQKDGMEMLTSLIKMSAEENGMALTIVDNQIMPTASPFSNRFETNNNNAHPEIPDEIGIKIEPTMNFTHRLFFATVHVYLLLMFLVSIPCSKTKLVVKRRILETKSAIMAMSKIH